MVYFQGSTAVVDLVLLITEVSGSHSVGLLPTSDRFVTKNSTWQHTTLTRDIYATGGFGHAIPASERPHTHAIHRAATGISFRFYIQL